jgi:hypothetical protein
MGRLSKVGVAFLRLVAVAGPVLLGVLTALYIGRPSPYFLATGITLVVAILACDGWIVARRHWIMGGFALATQTAFLIFVGTYTASPLAAPSPISDPLPQASPPGGMAIYALPTGVNNRTAAFAYRHTPGSVAAFVTLPSGARYAFVGDLVWQLEGLLDREGRPWFEAKELHEDPVALQRSLLRMNAIATRFPQITMVPSHDPRGYASILEWSRSATR